MSDMAVPAIIMANGNGSKDFNQPHKCLAEVATGRPMISCIVEALNGAKYVDEITVIEPPNRCISTSSHTLNCGTIAAEGVAFSDTLEAASRIADGRRVLLVCSDLICIDPYGLDRFLEASIDQTEGIIFPLIWAKDFKKMFPEARKTSAHLIEGELIIGNMFLINPELLEKQAKRLCEAFESRKKTRGLAMLLGPVFLLHYLLSRYLPGMIFLREVEYLVGNMLDTEVRTVLGQSPTLCRDIDELKALTTYLIAQGARDGTLNL